ncbi:MAG: hypothetical protein AB7L91_08505 [Dehalococcoidia bacterium]
MDRLPSDAQHQYRYAQWPDSFGTPDLPWEAASAVNELRLLRDGRIPTVPLGKWFYRLRLGEVDWPAVREPEWHERALRLAAWAAAFEWSEVSLGWHPYTADVRQTVGERFRAGYAILPNAADYAAEFDSDDLLRLILNEQRQTTSEKDAEWLRLPEGALLEEVE